MLRLENVAMRYGQGPEVLHSIYLTLNHGDFIFLMGPSGAGKTSLLRVMGLVHTPSNGSVSVFGRDVASMARQEQSDIRRRIGIVFQDFRLLDHLSAFDNIALPLRIKGGRERQIQDLTHDMLAWFGLSEIADAMPSTLSVGQRQLVAAARAAIARPSLLLCDEPTSNIDGRRAHRLMRLFTELAKQGTTVVLATHNEELVDRYPHPVMQMNKGFLSGPVPPETMVVAAD